MASQSNLPVMKSGSRAFMSGAWQSLFWSVYLMRRSSGRRISMASWKFHGNTNSRGGFDKYYFGGRKVDSGFKNARAFYFYYGNYGRKKAK